ncbi:hypothetical protein ASF61_20900 [Duganella sp. Leaf126]|uniref:copper homeostasis protein CutC n=1 Tax=Duganella sp. Leaf126 TaxID=1736266 RepID=UPI0006F673FB|nr:copper homeostasis protein CutC [Duganella sp. Leaf126]KQQ45093.1 hypothetical protein ASF61_20900 [Duganella sp. Leaf126]
MAAILLEVCVDSLHGIAAALAGGADRIELCAALDLGGLTPGADLLRLAAACPLPVVARIRPRAGDFCFDAVEVQRMLNAIDAVAHAGLQGVSLGATLRDGRLDQPTLARLLARAHDHRLACTLHRAIDISPDLAQATRTAIDLGFTRILTSGGAPEVSQGIDGLLRCFDAAAGRIAIMPGAGIDAANIGRLRAKLPLSEVHASCSAPALSPTRGAIGATSTTCAAKVAALVKALA